MADCTFLYHLLALINNINKVKSNPVYTALQGSCQHYIHNNDVIDDDDMPFLFKLPKLSLIQL